jgi:hypothetical protein
MTVLTRSARAVAWVAGAVVAVAAGLAAARLIALVQAQPGLPPWDAAAHGLAGLEVAQALERFDPLDLIAALNRQTTWPFVHSLLLAPFFLLMGRDYATSDIASAVFYGITGLAVFAAGLALHPRRGAWIGAAAAALALVSPLFAFFGAVTMLEIPGAMLLAIALACHARSCLSPNPRPWLIGSGVAAAALFFCKYNYGVMWLVPLVAFEAGLHRAAERRARGDALASAVRGGLLRRPVAWIVIAFAAFVATLIVTGGFELTSGGRRLISVRSPGNLATVLYLGLLVSVVLLYPRRHAIWRERWRALPERIRVPAAVILVPIGIWFAVPPHLREFTGFMINRSEGRVPWTLDRLLYYPSAFVNEYSPWPWLGALVLALALAPRPPGARRAGVPRDPRVLLDFALAFGLAAALFHPFQQPRFLFTTSILIWLRAASSAVEWLDAGSERLRGAWRAGSEVSWSAALVALLAVSTAGHPTLGKVSDMRRGFLTAPEFEPVLRAVLDQSAVATGSVVLLGYGDQLSPGLLAWYALRHRADIPRERLPRRVPWLPPDASHAALQERIDRLRANRSTVISALPSSPTAIVRPDTRHELAADLLTAELLGGAGTGMASHDPVPATGWSVRTYLLGLTGVRESPQRAMSKRAISR